MQISQMQFKVVFLFLFLGSTNVFGQLASKPEEISPLLIGEQIPELGLTNANGQKVNLKNLASTQPTILIFFRGGWCPYCNKHLAEVGEIESKIKALGYQIIAISPDQSSKLAEAASKQKLGYQLLSDSACHFASKMGIAYQAPNHYLKTINESSGGLNTKALPVPALFVLDKNGAILFEHINPDFKKRISANYLLSVLEGLKD